MEKAVRLTASAGAQALRNGDSTAGNWRQGGVSYVFVGWKQRVLRAWVHQFAQRLLLPQTESANMNSFVDGGAGTRPPTGYGAFVSRFPAMGEARERVAQAADEAGPLDRKYCELIKLGISLGAGLELAVKSHVRRALEHGALITEIEQAILLGVNTRGFPATVAAWQWAWEQIDRFRRERP